MSDPSDSDLVDTGAEGPQPVAPGMDPDLGYTLPAPSYQDTLEEARASGYSWPEIHTHLAASTVAAADEGYSQAEIDEHLRLRDSEHIEPRMREDWAKRFATDETLVAGLSAPDPKIDLSASSDLWTDYGEALLNGEVRNPEDFALSYAASALNAAHEMFGVDTSDPVAMQRRRAAAAESADLIAAELPTREDLADATVALTQDTDLAPADVRERLIETWTETGMKPVEAAARAKADPNFAERLLSPDNPLGMIVSGALAGPTGLAAYGEAALELANTLKSIGIGFTFGLGSQREDFRARYETGDLTQDALRQGAQPDLGFIGRLPIISEALRLEAQPGFAEKLTAVITKTVFDMPVQFVEALLQQPETMRKVIENKGVTVQEALTTSMLMLSPSPVRGYGLQPMVPEYLPPLPREALGGPGPRGPGPIIEGEVVRPTGPLIRLPEPPPLPVIDLEAPLGTPARSIPAREALLPPPKTAEVMHNTAADLSLVGAEERIRMVAEPAFQQEMAIRMADDVVLPGVDRVSAPIEVWHASPHEFEKFDSSKIGTGQGAQSFGNGLYFAENPKVSLGTFPVGTTGHQGLTINYADPSATPQQQLGVAILDAAGQARRWETQPIRLRNDLIANYEQTLRTAPEAFIAGGKAQLQEHIAALKSLDPKKLPEVGIRLYKVNLHVDPTRLLDLDKPVSQQSPPVIAALAKLGFVGDGGEEGIAAPTGYRYNAAGDMVSAQAPQTGQEIMGRLERRHGKVGASDALRDAGIQGNRYLDAGSRDTGDGTRNYVIFHDSKIEALERNGTPIKPAEVAAKAQEMAEGYDAARALYQHFYGSLGDLLKDTTGGGTLGAIGQTLRAATRWFTPEGRAAHDDFSRSRDILHRVAIPELMKGVKQDVLLARMMDNYRPLMAPHVNAFARASRAGDGQAMLNSEVGKLLHFIENRTWGGTLQNSKLAPLADALRSIAAHGEAEMQKAFAEGLIDAPTLLENWYKHLWKNPKGPNWDNLMGGEGVGGRQGSASFQRQRHFPTMADGMKAGLSPMFDNPIDQALYGEQLRAHYLNALRIVKAAMGEDQIYWAYEPRKAGDIRVNGIAPRTGEAFRQPGGNQPPSEFAMNLYGEPGFVRGYNNALSKGMNAHPVSANVYQRLIWFGNATTALKLLWPGFHFQTVSLGSIGTGFAMTMEHAGRAVEHGAKAVWSLDAAEAKLAGQEMFKTIWPAAQVAALGTGVFAVGALGASTAMGVALTAAGAAAAMSPQLWVGYRSMYRYNRDMADPILDYLTEAGLRVTPRQEIYNMGRKESLMKTAARGGFRPWEAGRSLAQGEVRQAVRHLNAVGGGAELMREIGRDLAATVGDPRFEGAGQRIVKFLPRALIGLPMTEMGRVLQTATSPFFDYHIVALKTGASYVRLKSWIDSHPFATDDEKWFHARQIVRDTENRIGELNMDVLFAPQLAKQIGLVSLLSLGWKYGSWRAFFGMLGWDIERGGRLGKIAFSPVLVTSFVGTLAAYMTMNAISQYLHTRTFPWQTNTVVADFLNGRTGGTSTSGSPARIWMPAELKEQYDMAKIVLTSIQSPKDGPHASAEYVINALNPAWRALHDTFIIGKDGIGISVWDRPGGYPAYLQKHFGPIVWNAMQEIRQGSGLTKFEVLMGTREASRWITDWDAHLKGLEKGHEKTTKEELQRAKRDERRLQGLPPSTGGRGGGVHRGQQNDRPIGSPGGGGGGSGSRSQQNDRPLR